MAGQFINPNWHVILIHYPLGLLTIGIMIELFSFLWRGSTVRTAARWMILLGALACIPAVTSGLYAFRDVVSPGSSDEHTWVQVKQTSRWSPEQWEFMEDHITWAAIASALFVVAVVVWLGASDEWRRRLRWPVLIALLLGLAMMSNAAWHSGETVYRHGTAVRVEAGTQQAEPHAANEHHDETSRVEYYVLPLQLHLLMAGLVIAVAAGALGLSIRRGALEVDATDLAVAQIETASDPVASALAGRPLEPSPTEQIVLVGPPKVFPARFWIIACLLAIGTVAAGLWEAGVWAPKQVLEMLAQDRTGGRVAADHARDSGMQHCAADSDPRGPAARGPATATAGLDVLVVAAVGCCRADLDGHPADVRFT